MYSQKREREKRNARGHMLFPNELPLDLGVKIRSNADLSKRASWSSVSNQSLWNAFEGWIHDTATSVSETRNWPVVRPPFKLLLHGLWQYRTVDVRVLGCLVGENTVEVSCISSIHLLWISLVGRRYKSMSIFHIPHSVGSLAHTSSGVICANQC